MNDIFDIFDFLFAFDKISCLFQIKIDRLQGADITSLENKIQELVGVASAAENCEDFGQGFVIKEKHFHLSIANSS